MKLKQKIQINRNTKVGETLVCPICGSEFVKKSYQHVYCSLHCKDKRHNMINSNRHKNTYHNNDVWDLLTDNDWGVYYGDQE